MTKPLGDPIRHLNLVRLMSKATGVDLADVAASGALSQEEWAGMVTRCRTCQWADGCEDWLATRFDLPKPEDHVPNQCVNRTRLAQLAAE